MTLKMESGDFIGKSDWYAIQERKPEKKEAKEKNKDRRQKNKTVMAGIRGEGWAGMSQDHVPSMLRCGWLSLWGSYS